MILAHGPKKLFGFSENKVERRVERMENQALYIDISQKILESIRSGEYSENSPLPTERELCDKYHASRTTIRQAIQRLKEEDVIYTVQGNGIFIKPQVFTQSLVKFYSFTDTLKSSGILMQNEIVGYEEVPATAAVAKKTGHPEGSPFHKLSRLRSAKEYPLMLETTYLPKIRFPELNIDELSKGSLYEFLRARYNFRADKGTETFRPVMPNSEEKALLKVPSNVPCILLERFSYENNLLIEFTKSIVRGDKYMFDVALPTLE